MTFALSRTRRQSWAGLFAWEVLTGWTGCEGENQSVVSKNAGTTCRTASRLNEFFQFLPSLFIHMRLRLFCLLSCIQSLIVPDQEANCAGTGAVLEEGLSGTAHS